MSSGTKSSRRVIGANERIRFAVYGLRGGGGQHVDLYDAVEGVEVAYLADVDSDQLGQWSNYIEKQGH